MLHRAASCALGSVSPLRLKIAMTAPKTSTLAKTDNKLKSNRFPDFTNGGFKGHSINRVAAPALGGNEPILQNAACCTSVGNAPSSRPWLHGTVPCLGRFIVRGPWSMLRRFQSGRGSLARVWCHYLRRFVRVRVRSCQTDRAGRPGLQSCRDVATCPSSRSCRAASAGRKNPRSQSQRRQTM